MSNDEIILQFRKELQNLGYCKTVINFYPKQAAKFLKHTRKEHLEIKNEDIADYYSYLKTIISPRTKKPLSESYLHSILLAIKLYFDYLQRTGIIKTSPYQLKIKTPQSEERKVFTREEIKKLYNKSSPLQTIILHLCYACGLRRTESSELKIKDLDLENNVLYIRKGKGKKRRVIPFTKQVQKDIRNYLEEREKNKEESLFNITAERIYTEFNYLPNKNQTKPSGIYITLSETYHCYPTVRTGNGTGKSKGFFRT